MMIENSQNRESPWWVGYVVTFAADIVVMMVLTLLSPVFPLASFPAPFVLVTVMAAFKFGEGPTILAVVWGFICYAYLSPPYHGFWPPAASLMEWAGLVAFLFGNLTVGYVAIAMRKSMAHAEMLAGDLQKSEAQYRSLIDTMNEGFATADPDYVFTYVNLRLAEMLGYAPEEMIGRRIQDFLDEASRATMASQMAERRAGHYERYELTWMSKDGRAVHALVSPRPVVGSDGRFAGSFGAITDITDLKRAEERLRRSEERFRNLFERAGDALLLHDLDGRFVEVNEAACSTLGYSREELLGLSVPDIVMDYDQATLDSMWDDLVAVGPLTVTAIHRRKDGSTIPVEGRLSSFEYRDQILILAVVRDITERVRAEEERRALEKHVEEQKRSFYRETIFSVTEGKLDICEEADVMPYLASSEAATEVDTLEQVSDARHEVAAFCRRCGLTGDQLDMFMIAVGEAITNAVKHATKARVYWGLRDRSVWVGAQDSGPGIESLILPRAVLLRGFSTKPSLGLGYCVMLDVADHVHLKTDAAGTVVILEKTLEERSEKPSPQDLPDTWQNLVG